MLWYIKLDVGTLRDFYASALGIRVQETLCNHLNLCWPDLSHKRVLGLGYALPYLSMLRACPQQCFAFTLARQGSVPWPCSDRVATALVFEENLPLPDSSVDCILLIHALEYAENVRETLNEIWRVLVPSGRLIVVVPNRSGFWACNDYTPFGYGEPYSRQQIMRLFEETHFISETIEEIIHYMPSPHRVVPVFSRFFELLARYLLPYFRGLLICQAKKCVSHGSFARYRQSRRILVPALSPQARGSYVSFGANFDWVARKRKGKRVVPEKIIKDEIKD